MDIQELSQLSDEDLLQQAKKVKKEQIMDSVIFGFLIGVAIYSSVNNGFGLLTFLPVVWIPIIGRKRPRQKAVADLVKERGLM